VRLGNLTIDIFSRKGLFLLVHLVIDEVDGAAEVQVDKVYVGELLQQLGALALGQ